MGIENFNGLYTPICDVGEETLPAELCFADAVLAKARADWKRRLIIKTGKFIDVCPVCQEEERRESKKEEAQVKVQ